MSDTDDKETSGAQDAPAAESVPAEPVPTSPKPGKSGSSGAIAWLALLLALLALGAVAYTIYEDWRTQRDLELSSGNIEASISKLAARIDDTKRGLAAIETQLDVLARADREAGQQLAALEYDLDERLRRLDGLPARTGNLETALTALQGVSAGARETWLLGEAEYYMQLANAQLQLAGNPELAELALGVADERIAQLANPALTNVRIALADERAALAGLSTPDVEGITLRLASLARTVPTLPMRRVERIADQADAAPAEDAGRLDRAWNAIKQATSDLVKHRTTDESVMPMISPEAEYFVRTNLVLQLQTARLALLRGEQSVYAESLGDAASWLQSYFDSGSEAVGAALQAVTELRQGMFGVTPPDISKSLQLLRQYKRINEPAP